MYGQIHCVIRELVQKKFGNETWETVLKKSGLDEHQAFLMFTRYDDASTFELVGAVSDTLEISVETVLEVFGEFFFDYCIRHGYDKMLQTLGHDIKSFIQNLDSLHALLALSYKGISAPSFRCEDGPDGSLILHYYSSRPGLYPIVKGVLKAVARDLFDQSVEMSILEQNKEDIGCDKFQEHTAFLVQLRSNSTRNIKSRASPVVHEKSLVSFNPETVLLKASDFCSAFPYHVIFDRNLRIKQCGVLIQKHSCHVIQEGTPLNLAFDIVHPKMVISIENIRKFINAVFLLAICSDETEKKRMVVKGQMIWIEDTNHMIFIGSPRLTSLNELVEMNVYLADIPLYDVTRELVLLNQQRIAEIDIAKKLDETTAQLKKTGQELEVEKRKTETLLHQMLPRKVATALTQGRTVEAEKFDQVTILFSDIVTFTNIASACSPMDIVDMLNEMYRRFDERTSQHHVYKVETIGDAYMIVSGVPEKTDFHAPPVANFAMDMIHDAGQVMSPATGKPLQIRVGVHTGPVVAGVVGVKMPRYCLFGDTVNTASRMESHGVPARVHLSATTREALQGWGYVFKVRGEMEVKGKGKMATYFLAGTADRSIPEPDDDFVNLETFQDSAENRVSIKITSDSCEDLDLTSTTNDIPGTGVTNTRRTDPSATTNGVDNNKNDEEEEGEFDAQQHNKPLADPAYYDVLQNCPFHFGNGDDDDDDVNVTYEQASLHSRTPEATSITQNHENNIHNGNTHLDNRDSGGGPRSNSLSTDENEECTSPTKSVNNTAVVDNVFFNVCCGFSSSMFSQKAYNSMSVVENNNSGNSSSSRKDTRNGNREQTPPHSDLVQVKTFSTHEPKARPIPKPLQTTPAVNVSNTLFVPTLRPRHDTSHNNNSNNTSHSNKKQNTDNKHNKPTARTYSNVVSPLQNDILASVPETTHFTNDSMSMSSVQSFTTSPSPSPEPHPNHVYRCQAGGKQQPVVLQGIRGLSAQHGKPAANIPPTKGRRSAIEHNNIDSCAVTSNNNRSTTAEVISSPVPVNTSDVCPSALSVECDSSSTNLRTSWSHDHLLKVRKTKKKSVKKDRSKMCSLS